MRDRFYLLVRRGFFPTGPCGHPNMGSNDFPIYLDYNATTPLDPRVKEDMIGAMDLWKNPSSSYSGEVKEAIEKARKSVGEMIGVREWKKEIIFTSGGTEANNWVLMSIAESSETVNGSIRESSETMNGSIRDSSETMNGFVNKWEDRKFLPHIITSNIEHDAVKIPLESMVKRGRVEVTFVPVDTSNATMNVDQLLSAIKPNTILITLMLANNETGVIQPVAEVGRKLSTINTVRTKNNLPKILLHSDAGQAIGKIPVHVQSLGVDFLTIVGHKFYAPRIGALYANSDLPLKPLFFGGGQERALRPGTENTLCIVGLGTASDLVIENIDTYKEKMNHLKTYFITKLKETFTKEEILVNFENTKQLPNTISVSLIGSEYSGKEILKHVDRKLQASTGSACHSSSRHSSSSILISSGLDGRVASKTIRLSVGRETTMQQLDHVLHIFHDVVHSTDQDCN